MIKLMERTTHHRAVIQHLASSDFEDRDSDIPEAAIELNRHYLRALCTDDDTTASAISALGIRRAVAAYNESWSELLDQTNVRASVIFADIHFTSARSRAR